MATLPQLLALRRHGPQPLHHEIALAMERAVTSGALRQGTRLEPEKDVASQLNVSVATVRRAWSYLERKGLITRKRKAGTFVC